MADGIFPGLVSATRDVNAVTNPIFTKITDGTTGISLGGGVEAGALLVTIASDSTGVVTVDGTVAATQSGSWDIGTVTTLTGITNDVNIADGGNSITVDGTVAISGSVAVTTDQVQYAVDAVAGAADVGNLALVVRDDALTTLTPVDGDYTQLRVGSTGALWVTSTPLTLSADAVKVSGNSTANGILNPIFVQNVSTAVLGDEIHDYDTATPAGDAGSNHDYTVTGTTFLLKSVIFSCSGAGKAEIQAGPVGALVTVAVVFLNARQGDTKQVFFDPAVEVPVTSTGTVRVIRTNRNAAATDVYSTIIGNDVA